MIIYWILYRSSASSSQFSILILVTHEDENILRIWSFFFFVATRWRRITITNNYYVSLMVNILLTRRNMIHLSSAEVELVARDRLPDSGNVTSRSFAPETEMLWWKIYWDIQIFVYSSSLDQDNYRLRLGDFMHRSQWSDFRDLTHWDTWDMKSLGWDDLRSKMTLIAWDKCHLIKSDEIRAR